MARKPKAVWKPHRDAELRRASAISLIQAILRLEDLYPPMKRKFLSNCLWQLTQAEGPGKYETRYCSRAASKVDKRTMRDCNHDHVFRRKLMVDKLLQTSPDQVEEIVREAVGCTVLKKEHKRLAAVDKKESVDGWERYRRAKIVVIDRLTGKPARLG